MIKTVQTHEAVFTCDKSVVQYPEIGKKVHNMFSVYSISVATEIRANVGQGAHSRGQSPGEGSPRG